MSKINLKKIKSTKIYSGKVLNFFKDDILINSKIKSVREYVYFPDAAGIIPVTDDGKIILVEQYRYVNNLYSLEIPAGKKDDNETILQCAKRELEEETGYKAGRLIKLCEYFPAVSYSTEKLHLFIAKGLQKGSYKPDEDEIIKIHILPLEKILNLIKKNKIKDSKTILAILFYVSNH